jgi:hypothetical protein
VSILVGQVFSSAQLLQRARRMRREVIDAGQDTDAPNWGRDKKE